jgi:hypothetical protein
MITHNNLLQRTKDMFTHKKDYRFICRFYKKKKKKKKNVSVIIGLGV